jgi:hypothetical protein
MLAIFLVSCLLDERPIEQESTIKSDTVHSAQESLKPKPKTKMALRRRRHAVFESACVIAAISLFCIAYRAVAQVIVSPDKGDELENLAYVTGRDRLIRERELKKRSRFIDINKYTKEYVFALNLFGFCPIY